MNRGFGDTRGLGIAWRSGLCLSVSVFALAAGAPAMAQQTTQQIAQPDDATVVDEVVVTGLRRGLADAISIKRNETSIVEAISAEDIGKLPDVSIAESIARLPGLAAQRVNGRAQVISIRGLAPDFTTTLLNGRQQASSGDNRAVEFDQYPSELLSGVVIYKTPDAQISGMGLSGTADLRTVRPLEYGRQAIALNLRGEVVEDGDLNDDMRSYGGRFSVSYIDQFMDDTVGLALGYAHLDSPSVNRHVKSYSYEDFSTSPAAPPPGLFLNGQEIFATSRLNTRDAVIGILEWRPNDILHSTLDVYYSKFEQEEAMRGALWFANPYADNATFSNTQFEDRGGTPFAVSGTQNRVVPIIRNDNNTRDDEIFSIGLNNEFQLDDRTRVIADLSYSSNRRQEQVIETYAGYGLGVGGVSGATPDAGRTFDNIDYELRGEDFPTYSEGLDYADASQVSLGDRAPWGGWGHDGSIRFPDVEEHIFAVDIRGELSFDGPIHTVTGGINLTNREKTKDVTEFDLMLKNGRQQVLVDPQYLIDPTSLDYAGFGDVLSIDIPSALDVYWNQTPILDSNNYDKNWEISERVVTFFVKADFEFGAFRGNFGVQVVPQRQESEGVVLTVSQPGVPIVPTSRTVSESYTDVLPSLNLIYDLGGGHRLRFAAAKTMARPRMDDLRSSVVPGFNTGICNSTPPCVPGQVVQPWSASGGNTLLEPWRATAYDLAYEWYVDSTTYFSVAAFYKDLDTYIYNQTLPFDFTGIPLPVPTGIPAGVIVSPIGQITLPTNGNGGSIEGVEVSGALDFGNLWEPLTGFGFIGSASWTESDLNPGTDPNAPVRIPGLSGFVYNATAYFERGGFQARISKRFREAFKGEVVQLFTNRAFTEILDDEQVDAQIGYTFESGSLEGLGLLFQVNNLTNSPYRTRVGIDGGGVVTADGTVLPETYEEYGRQYLFGINYRF